MYQTPKNNNPTIQFYNVFAEEGSKYHLTVKEFYLYGILQTLRNREYQTIINVEILHEYSKEKFYSRKKENQQAIRQLLYSLKEKEIIHFDNEKITNHSLLIINFYDDLKDDKVKGFETVEIVKFMSFSMLENYIYFTVKRFDKVGSGFECSQERWADILNMSQRSAKSKLDKALEKEIIYKNIGDYEDDLVEGRQQKRQSKNTYRTTSFSELELSRQSKKANQKKANKKFRDDFNDSSNYIQELKDRIYFFKTYQDENGENLFPLADDYAFYFEVKDNIQNFGSSELELTLIKTAEKRMRQMKNNDKFYEELEEGREMYLYNTIDSEDNDSKEESKVVNLKQIKEDNILPF